MTALLFLAGIVVLPGVGPTYAQEPLARLQPHPLDAPAVAHNTWTTGKAMPTPVCYAPTAVLGNEIYILGGCATATTGTAKVQIYNPAKNSWSKGVSLPKAIWAEAAAVVKGQIYIMGGATTPNPPWINTVYSYNPKTKKWTRKANVPNAIAGAVAVVENNIIHLLGGTWNDGYPSYDESYNPATNAWKKEAALLVGKSQFVAGKIGTTGNTIFATDGVAQNSFVGDNEGYDVTKNAWAPLAADPTARTGLAGERSVTNCSSRAATAAH